MADKLKWKVLRRHEGDRWYDEGEIRIGSKAELGHLAPLTLELLNSKSAPSNLNKAEPASRVKVASGRKAN